jgi:hypothetical protein
MADTPRNPSDVPPNAPAKTLEKKVEIKEIAKEKELKIEVKELKLEKIEIKEHKDLKIEKLEKNENKEHKDSKIEKLEKNEAKEHKDAKHEKFEQKEIKIEQKEIGKLELPEKTIPKEKDGKEIFEGGGIDPGDPLQQRLAALEQNVAGLQHFIATGQRPDLSRGALSREPDKGGTSSGG